MKLKYVQFKANVNSILWIIGNGFGMSYYPTKFVYRGHTLGDSVWLGRKGYGYFFCANETTRLKELSEEIEKELEKDPDHIVQVRKIFETKVKEKQDFLLFLKEGNLKKMSDEKLYDYYKNILKTYQEVYHFGEPITFISKNFAKNLKKYLLKKGGSEKEFYTFISPIEKSFLQVQEQEMLKIAIDAKKLGISDFIRKEILEHTEKFNWIPYDYGTHVYNEDHFLEELNRVLKNSNGYLQEKYSLLQNYTQRTITEQKEIIDKYNIDEYHKKLFTVVRHSYFLIDAKKEFFSKLHLYSQRIFTEISERLELDINLVRNALPEEIESYLVKKQKPDIQNLMEREENYYIVTRADGKLILKQGNEAKEIIDEFISDYNKNENESEEINGNVAMKGKVNGIVRIVVNAKECNKVNHGDVLVTTMTSPDYMLAVKKAAAIITDEGGITCHASIIARELKIPTIIGTQNATQVLKDGDLVEVDADNGVVRILERKEK